MARRAAARKDLRLFVALDPPARVCSEVEAWARQTAGLHREMRAVPAANCHITLAFLGSCDVSTLAALECALESAGSSVRELSLGAPVWLPRKRPRALALEVHDGLGELEDCHSRLAAALDEAIGWRPERRFRPHLTAARMSRGLSPGEVTLPVSPIQDFDGEAVTLYQSQLLAEGARYEALARIQL